MKQSWPYLLIVIALFLGINAPALFSEGMFMDGLFYSTISRNLAFGEGTFWDLFYTETYNQHFHGHPPLAMGMQALFYSIFGDHIHVEHLYSLTLFIASSYLLVKIWLKLVDRPHRKFFWIPLLLHSIIGVVGWAVANNMLENTMTLFVLLSFYSALLAVNQKGTMSQLGLSLLAGGFIFMAFLTKGLVGLFPLSSIFFISLFDHKVSIKSGILLSFIMLIGLLLPFSFLYLFVPEAIDSLNNYFQAQVVHSLNKVEISNRYFILGSLFQQLIPLLGLVLLTFFLNRKQWIKLDTNRLQKVFFLVAIGLSGVLPIIISLKQRDFYIVSTYPFFALALGLLLVPFWKKGVEQLELNTKRYKGVKLISLFLLFVSLIITAFQFNRVGRDQEMIEDIQKISEVIPPKSIITIPPSLSQDWSLRGYFARYHSVSLTFDETVGENYYLSKQKEEVENFELLDEVKLNRYYLYQKK
ncbi:MAG: glycosyltransferase family 39 protein [Flavobacteriales bacterium]|jgi:4-amino-4-deoxy-L-arabinose transferase-like glycosyltransferase|nr:glycosyltransferase family 39 protein [Flavobacteriales bacterium]